MEVDRGIKEKPCDRLLAPSCLVYHDLGSGSQLGKIYLDTFIIRLFFSLFLSFDSLLFWNKSHSFQFPSATYNPVFWNGSSAKGKGSWSPVSSTIIFIHWNVLTLSTGCFTTCLSMFSNILLILWGYFTNIPRNVWEHSPECLAIFSRMFDKILRNIWGHSPECLVIFPGMFGDISRNVWGHSQE